MATLLGFVLPLTYGANWVLNRIYPYRVSVEGERQGMDLHELGAGAYPEFITHTEDFIPRIASAEKQSAFRQFRDGRPAPEQLEPASSPLGKSSSIEFLNRCYPFFEFAFAPARLQTA